MTQIEVQSVTDELAESIKKIDDAMTQMRNSALSEEAITLLLWHMIGQKNIRKIDVNNVLWGLKNLKSTYLKGNK